MRVGLPVAALAALIVYGCVAPRERAPEPAPTPAPTPPVAAPRPTPVPAPTPATPPPSWADLPDTPGAWTYRTTATGSAASFGAGAPLFTLSCEPAARSLRLERPGAGALTVRTSYGVQQVAAALPASSPLADQMAFSRGHFTVDAPGLSQLVLPAQPEVARVVEDCRA